VTAAPRERGEAHGGAEQTLPASEEPFDHPVGEVAGFSFGTSLYLTLAGSLRLCKSAVLPICHSVPPCTSPLRAAFGCANRLSCRFVSACRRRRQGPSTPQAGTAVSLHQPPGGLATAPLTHTQWQHPLPAQDAVPRWHHPCHVTPGLLPSALRPSLRLFKIAPGDFVEPLDFIARLAALVPKPRVNLTRLDARHPWRAPFGRTACVQIHSR